ncbi:MAG: Peptidoglycan O-acetyltransferase [Planctomycetes bacterium ADurb.Bin401]|nr:MAG: Peptidoglycan O-acetyltransferase [Planctomycetes bacterium ADurb.Bin401]
MLFTDLRFIFIFLPFVLSLFYFTKSKNFRLLVILISSYIFYGSWNYKFLSLLFTSTVLDFFSGLAIYRFADKKILRKSILIFSMLCNLAILGIFKYYDFFITQVQTLLVNFGFQPDLPLLHVILPVGISFYTFQSMSYTIDIYFGSVTPTRNFFKFSAFIALYPQLVAGPIVRYKQINRQLEHINRPFSLKNFCCGIQLFVLGLAKKTIIADYIAGIINPMFERYLQIGMIETWLIILGYAFQIYFDFSGYSDMAIGLGKMLGFKFPYNFNSPYKARSVSDFWRRWHMTLSSFLKDYLYIPLGGNRTGLKKTIFNVMVVFLLCGIWHGAAWTFIIWGCYYGILAAGYNFWKNRWDGMPILAQRSFTFVLVLIGWVLFRSNNIPMAGTLLSKMFDFSSLASALPDDIVRLLILNIVLLVAVNSLPNSNSFKISQNPIAAISLALLFLLSLIAVNSLSIQFLYYQF